MPWRNSLVRRAVNALERVGYSCSPPSSNARDVDILVRRMGETSAIKVKCPGRSQSRPHIYKRCLGHSIYMIFQIQNGRWYLVPHDDLVVIAGKTTTWLDSKSWRICGEYSSAKPSVKMLDRLRCFSLDLGG